MALIVADSDVLIDALRGRPAAEARVERELRGRRLATTAVTVFELFAGARTQRERRAIERLLTALTILPFDELAAESAAGIRQALEQGGAGIGMADYLIAGICVSRSASLLTRNRRHFDRVPGLSVEDPTA